MRVGSWELWGVYFFGNLTTTVLNSAVRPVSEMGIKQYSILPFEYTLAGNFWWLFFFDTMKGSTYRVSSNLYPFFIIVCNVSLAAF